LRITNYSKITCKKKVTPPFRPLSVPFSWPCQIKHFWTIIVALFFFAYTILRWELRWELGLVNLLLLGDLQTYNNIAGCHTLLWNCDPSRIDDRLLTCCDFRCGFLTLGWTPTFVKQFLSLNLPPQFTLLRFFFYIIWV
jgi:hypothetical protein